MKLDLGEDKIHPINKKRSMLRVRTICCRNKADPHKGMGAHLIGVDLRNQLHQTLQELPLVVIRCHSAEIDLRSLDKSHPREMEHMVVFRVRGEIITRPVKVVLKWEA